MRPLRSPRTPPWIVPVVLAALAPACTLHHRYEALRLGALQRPNRTSFDMMLGSYEVGPSGPSWQNVTAGGSLRLLSHPDRGGLEGTVHLRLHAWRIHSDYDAWTNTRAPYRPGDPHMRRVPWRSRIVTQRYIGRGHLERFSTGIGLDLIGGAYGPWRTRTLPDGRPRDELILGDFTPGVAVGAFARGVIGPWFSVQAEAGYMYADRVGGPFIRFGLGFVIDRTVTPGLPRLDETSP